jgi:threonylcarbamoyladenosine tRNA methylthiotransferase MtaB
MERITSFAGHQRAFLKVQDGCDAFCSYCIIPRLRPWPRSKPIKVAVAEARDLVRAGHKEIVVTGVFLGAYGRETAVRRRWARQGSPLAALVDALARVEGLRRLRLSSLEPGDVDEALLEELSAHKNCVPHLHLPLQSGSASILRRMNRQYTVAAFVEMIQRVRAALDRPAVSTDIIVGFPGETERDFEASIDIARRVEFCKIHAFPFSPRDQTVAARWRRDFVHPNVVRDRMRRLAEVERECSFRFRRRFVGQVERVIVEESGTLDGQTDEWHNVRHGRSDRYFKVHFETDEVRPGDLVSVRIDRVTPTRTHGRCLDASADSHPLHVTSTR